jgi:hypothetical protein
MPKKTPVGKRGPAVSFHDAPPSDDAKRRYKDIIARAKNKDRERPGEMKGTPRFDEVDSGWDTQARPSHLSEKTTSQLQAVAEATAAATAAQEEGSFDSEEEDPYALDGTSIRDRPIAAANIAEAEPEEDLTDDEKLRRAVESRLKDAIDIGQYLMNGETTQSIPIIPKKLVVKFRTVTDLEESFVDDQLAKEGDMTARAFLRRANEWALAFHIAEVNGHKWPITQDGDGTVNEKSIQRRLVHVRKLSSPVFTLIIKNLAWYLERVQDSLNMEALGNG